jgi:hypothetical protein
MHVGNLANEIRCHTGRSSSVCVGYLFYIFSLEVVGMVLNMTLEILYKCGVFLQNTGLLSPSLCYRPSYPFSYMLVISIGAVISNVTED